MKPIGSFCPLCQQIVVLGDLSAPREEMESRYTAHLATHQPGEWARCVQDLRDGTEQREQLRRIPYWAMPAA